MYTSKLQAHLQAQEEDKKAKQKKWKKLMGDRMPRLYDGDEFYNCIVKMEEEMEKEEKEKEEWRHICEQHTEVLVAWKKEGEERKAHNEKQQQLHQAAVKDWEGERDQAKTERGWPH